MLICYDCANDRRRLKTANILLDYGDRVQRSVFETELPQRLEQEMTSRLGQVINTEQDSVRIYHICDRCRSGVHLLGLGDLMDTGRTIVV